MGNKQDGGYGRRTFLQALGGATALGALAGVNSAANKERIIVGVEDRASLDEVRADVAADPSIPTEVDFVHHNDAIDYAVVEVPKRPSTQSTKTNVETLGSKSSVRYAESDFEVRPEVEEIQAVEPNDPRWGEEWADEAIDVPTAWETTQASMDTTLAIVDTGLDIDHPDLTDRVTSEVGGPDPEPSDDSFDHGTHCGGCAAATTGNGIGVAGPANCRLIGYSWDNLRVEDAIVDAADEGADVISMSFSAGYDTSSSLQDALQYATDRGAICVAASANDSKRDEISAPAKDPNVIAVGATNRNGGVADFSNSSPNLDIVAPGVDVLSTLPQTRYGTASGTSMACPVAAGVIALLKDLDPSLTTEEVRTLVTDTAAKLSGVEDSRQAAGQINAAAAVESVTTGNVVPKPAMDVSTTKLRAGNTVDFDASGSSDSDGSISRYDWAFGDGTTATGQTASHTYSSAGDYTATLTVTDGNGASNTVSETISVVSESAGIENGTYVVENVNSGKVLDIANGGTGDGDSVVQWTENGGTDQRWQVVEQTTLEYTIENLNSGKMLDVENDSTSRGDDVIQWSATGGDDQRWEIREEASGEYRIENVNSGKVLDVYAKGTSDGDNLVQWDWYEDTNQLFRFVSVSADTDAPTAPSNLAASNVTETSVALSWDASTDSGSGIDSYVVTVNGSDDTTVSAGTTSASVTALSAGTSYQFGVRAVDSAGNASSTVTVSATTDSSSSGSEYPAWDSSVAYSGGDRVSYDGYVWEAQWWTSGDEPGSSQWGPWEKVSGGGGGGNEGPTASMSASPTDVTVGDAVSVDASGSSDSDGSISSYEWSFGDGTTAIGQTSSHSYDSSGDYTITVTVTDDDGATDSTSTTVTVQSDDGDNQPDVPEWDSGATYTGGDQVTYNGAVWEAQWWTRGDEPGSSEWGPWEQV